VRSVREVGSPFAHESPLPANKIDSLIVNEQEDKYTGPAWASSVASVRHTRSLDIFAVMRCRGALPEVASAAT
jgi:hypothetical protein